MISHYRVEATTWNKLQSKRDAGKTALGSTLDCPAGFGAVGYTYLESRYRVEAKLGYRGRFRLNQ